MDSMQMNDSPSEGSIEPSEEMATQIQDEEHFSNEKNVTDNQNIADNQNITDNQIRNAVLSIMTGESLKWTMKQWRENITNILDTNINMSVRITDSDVKERLKAIVHEEGFKYVKSNLDSQTQDDGDHDDNREGDAHCEADADVIGDNADTDDEMDVLDESTQRQSEIEDEAEQETEQQAAGEEEVGEVGRLGEGEDENTDPHATESTQPQVTFLFLF